MARKSGRRQTQRPRLEIDPEEESQEVPEPELEPGEDEVAAGHDSVQGERVSPGNMKRGDKTALVAEIWRSMPDATAGQIADEYQRRTGDTVSRPTITNAKPTDLKRSRRPAQAQPPKPSRRAVAERPVAREPELTLDDLRQVKRLANQVGGIRKLKEAVDALTELASE